MRPFIDPFATRFEGLESPFLSGELLSSEGPAPDRASIERERSGREVDFEDLDRGPTKTVDFLGGRLWTFTAATLPMRVSVYCPKKIVSPQQPMDLLFYAHGDPGGCSPIPKTMPEDFVTKAPFELGKIIDASNRRIALVVPHMDWSRLAKNKLDFVACNRTDASLHALGVPANLNGVLKEALAEIGRVFGSPAPAVENLILAGHSRAHGFFNVLALLHVDTEMRKGVLASLKEVWCLDSTYFCFMAEWLRWLRSGVNLSMSVFYRPGTGTAAFGRKFEAAVPTFGGGKLMVTAAKEGHCAVPAKRLPDLLARRAHYTASEVAPLNLEQWTASESPQVFEDGRSEAFEEEILGATDDRTLVANTFSVPNRWICAIDIQTDNPKWGSHGQPKYLIKSRGTGTLIGPRYVLTAAHILGRLDGNDTPIDVKGLLVSPARDGSNSRSPLGTVKSRAVRVSARYQVTLTITQGPRRGTRVSHPRRDDYALIILEKDVSASTHTAMKGPLGYWGENPAVSAVARLEPAVLNGKDVVVIGYPGDTCGTSKWSGSASQKQPKIDDCWNRRNDEWANRQWRSTGTLQVDPDLRRLYHTADTYQGQSGAPICVSIGSTLHLAGVHTNEHTAQTNQGVRVTRRMLQEIQDWINADAGFAMASIQNDTLVLQPAARGAVAKELVAFDEAEQEAFNEEDFDAEDPEDPEDNETRVGVDEVGLEERFDPAAVPANVAAARDKRDWPLMVKLALEAGIRKEGDLTNIIFFALHPELPPEPLKKDAPNFKTLRDDWNRILVKEVKPAIAKAVENTSLKVPAKYVLERDPMFAGESGSMFKAIVEEAARDVDINPGLLSAVLLAEWDKRSLYLSRGQVRSFVSGTDDFFAMRSVLAANVPAFSKVRFDSTTSTNTNEHGRIVTTVSFKSGKDAVLATAVYLKYAEIKLRKAARHNSADFDAFPIETKLALVRVAMASGHGGITPEGEWVWFKKKTNGKWGVVKKGTPGAVLRGVAPRLATVLEGGDFLVRRNEPRRDPTSSAHITNRNATILVAQALHLSDWMFGRPLTPVAQPETEWPYQDERIEFPGADANEAAWSSTEPVGELKQEPEGELNPSWQASSNPSRKAS
jgi:V8-like Glu-specific endopeptidase